jgi:hypothetical protein
MTHRGALRTAEKSFLQKWILDAKPAYPILFIAPWSSLAALITAYHKTIGDNSFFFFTKKQHFMGEDAVDSDIYSFPFIGGRKGIQAYIDQRRELIGAQNIRIQPPAPLKTRDDFF